jgi:hypothetical protein
MKQRMLAAALLLAGVVLGVAAAIGFYREHHAMSREAREGNSPTSQSQRLSHDFQIAGRRAMKAIGGEFDAAFSGPFSVIGGSKDIRNATARFDNLGLIQRNALRSLEEADMQRANVADAKTYGIVEELRKCNCFAESGYVVPVVPESSYPRV